jgi:hypothetical protein
MPLSELLNLSETPHSTVVIADFTLDGILRQRLLEEARSIPTRLVIVEDWPSTASLDAAIRAYGVDPQRDYVSLLVLSRFHASFRAARKFFDTVPRGDFSRLELPPEELGFTPARATWLLGVALDARFDQQDELADRFFGLLEEHTPYQVEIRTAGGVALIRDDRPWFQLGGRLSMGEVRILPGGEVAYTGGSVDGIFRVDGALLATPQRVEGIPLARSLIRHSACLAAAPVDLEVVGAEVRAVRGDGPARAALEQILADSRYRQVTEVGVSFNEACTQLIHDWAAASNESYPGAHIAIGGAPDTRNKLMNLPTVHVDLISGGATVYVNGHLFLERQR